jgi:hypothetical protein
VDPQWFQFNADPDPAFYLIADPNPVGKSLRIHADLVPDSDPGKTFQ